MQPHLLVTLDGSAESERVLPEATALATALQARLTLLRVVPPIEAYAVNGLAMPIPTTVEDEQRAVQDYLEEIRERLRGQVAAEVAVGFGPVAEAIVEEARERHATLIALATHGRSGLARTVMGSAADAVVRAAPCPVLLVRTNLPRHAASGAAVATTQA